MKSQAMSEEELRSRILVLLKQIGTPGRCRACGATIYWVQHLNKRWAPYTELGLNHFADCPKREEFKRGSKTERR